MADRRSTRSVFLSAAVACAACACGGSDPMAPATTPGLMAGAGAGMAAFVPNMPATAGASGAAMMTPLPAAGAGSGGMAAAPAPMGGVGGSAGAAGSMEPPMPDACEGFVVSRSKPCHNDPNPCNIQSGYPGDEYCLLPPPPGEGIQVHFGPSSYTDKAEVAKYLIKPSDESNDYGVAPIPDDRGEVLQPRRVLDAAGLAPPHQQHHRGPSDAGLRAGGLGLPERARRLARRHAEPDLRLAPERDRAARKRRPRLRAAAERQHLLQLPPLQPDSGGSVERDLGELLLRR